MAQRLQLQELLETFGAAKVYFQPPASIKLEYPAIIYARNYANTLFADNSTYRNTKRYQVMVIDRNPDSLIPDKVAALPMCLFDRHYVADNLNHDVFNLYF